MGSLGRIGYLSRMAILGYSGSLYKLGRMDKMIPKVRLTWILEHSEFSECEKMAIYVALENFYATPPTNLSEDTEYVVSYGVWSMSTDYEEEGS